MGGGGSLLLLRLLGVEPALWMVTPVAWARHGSVHLAHFRPDGPVTGVRGHGVLECLASACGGRVARGPYPERRRRIAEVTSAPKPDNLMPLGAGRLVG
jgi:hypothetical protein